MTQFATLKQTGWGRYPLSEGPLFRPERRAELSAILNAGLFTSYSVLFGLFRYWFLVENGDGESPTDVVWTDIPLGLTVVVWGALCLMAVWQ